MPYILTCPHLDNPETKKIFVVPNLRLAAICLINRDDCYHWFEFDNNQFKLMRRRNNYPGEKGDWYLNLTHHSHIRENAINSIYLQILEPLYLSKIGCTLKDISTQEVFNALGKI
jgi:hypothetical protein